MAGANKKGGNMRVDYYLGEESLILDECQSKLQEVDDYWDRENEYIKTCGIYTPKEVEQILANHNEIRRSKKDEIKKKYDKLLGDYREQIQLDREINSADGLYMDDDLDDDMIECVASNDDAEYYQMLRDMKEERDAYDDFIASMDMNDY